MLEEARNILRKNIGKTEKIAVAVSGGMDSMCLLHLVIQSGITDKNNIVAVNIDHRIRGESSLRDSMFVRRYCESEGIEFIGESVDVPMLCKKSGKSIETQARDERRRIFCELLCSNRASKVLLAHHAGDQAETVLMHIFRGAGINGLTGMKILDGGILRPLLTVPKNEIEQYVSNYAIPFVTDETNSMNDYNRNYIRNEVMPAIRRRWVGIEGALAHLSEAAEESCRLVRQCMNEELIYTDELKNGVVKLDIKCFAENAPYAQYVFEALAVSGVYSDIEYKHIVMIKDLSRLRNGAKINLIGGVTAIKEYDRIAFYRESKTDMAGERFRLGIFDFGRTRAVVYSADAALVHGGLVFDYDKVPPDSVIRKRKSGDVFKPVGNGTKKLKEYLIDKKIPQRLRDGIPCLCAGNEVLVLFGVEISERVKIDENTANAVRAEIMEEAE